jgi:hypothetical protein
METLAMIRQAFRKESMSHTRVTGWKSTKPLTPKKTRQVKGKVKSMLITLFDIKGIVHKEFVLAGQTVNSTYYCDVLCQLSENVRSLHPKLW